MTLYIRTQQHEYHVLDTGEICRLSGHLPMAPSGEWKMQGIVHCRSRQCFYTLSEIRQIYGGLNGPMARPELLYKNGKPQYRMIDLDHGTTRVQRSDGILHISVYEND